MSITSVSQRWPYRADRPDRYGRKFAVYKARGGLLDIEQDVLGFTGGAEHSGDIARFYFFCVAFDQMMKEGVTGDVAELGVYRGRTATLLAAMARRMGTTAYLLDTFEGFAEQDLSGIDRNRKTAFQDTSLEAVRAVVGEENTVFVKGFFPDSAAQLPAGGAYCFVHIDCDLYAPVASALAYFYPRLTPGGFLVVHDYGSLDWNGAERAVDEFFADKPEPVMPLTDRAGSVAVRKARPPGRGNWYLQRCAALLQPAWQKAAKGGLQPMLYAGWSEPEPWGVWGVGRSHEMRLVLRERPLTDVIVELEVGSSLVGRRQRQEVAVGVSGAAVLANWQFSQTRNRGVRQVSVPARFFDEAGSGYFSAWLSFAPLDVAPVRELDPEKGDVRALGMSLCAIRRIQ